MVDWLVLIFVIASYLIVERRLLGYQVKSATHGCIKEAECKRDGYEFSIT